MENIVLKPEWVKSISLWPETAEFLEALLEYKITRVFPLSGPDYALFAAIQPEFDKLNFPLDNGCRCAKVPTDNV